jgi:fibronectin type 3 domain-containing protein
MAPGMKKGLVLGFAVLLIVVAYFSYEWWQGSWPHTVTIRWQAPDGPPPSRPLRYNVYRSDDGGASFSCILSRMSGTMFRDSRVESGKCYRYAVTAVDERGQESERSVPVDVTIPK